MLKPLLKLKLQAFLAMFGGRTRKSTLITKIAFALLLVYAGVAFAFIFIEMFSSSAAALANQGLGWLYFSFYGLMAFSVMFISSIFTAKSQLFEAKDTDLMLSLPIKSKYILASRMFLIVLFNFVFELIVAIPAIYVWTVTAKQTMGAIEITAFVLLSLSLLLFTTMIACLVGWLINLITSRLRSKNIATIILSFLFIGVYMYVYPKLNIAMLSLVTETGKTFELLAASPLKFIGTAIADGNILHFVYGLLIFTVPFAVFYALLSRNYIEILSTKHSGKKLKYKHTELQTTDKSTALLKQQLSLFFSSAPYVINAALGILMMIAGAVALFFVSDKLNAVFSEFPKQLTNSVGILAVSVGFVFGSMSLITAPSISIEAKTLWILKSLPLSSREIIKAKLNMSNVLVLPVTAIFALSLCINLSIGKTSALFLIASLLLYGLVSANIGLIANILLPYFNWTDEVQAVKQSISVLLAVLLNIAIAVLPALLFIFTDLNKINPLIYEGIITAFMLILFILTSRFLYTYCAKRLERI